MIFGYHILFLHLEATVIPIPKPGKDHSDPGNYRPIALTSCLCKTMERMVNDRLMWYLESGQYLTEFQAGFRRHKSTIDHLIKLETLIRNSLIKGEHMTVIFFDLEKAYDTTWKYGILNDLFDMGLRGRLPMFIRNFLDERKFRVRLGTIFSDLYDQEMGVPQGSILSPTLFIIKINSIARELSTDCCLYVDDLMICYSAKNMVSIERQLQMSLDKIYSWANRNGFKFSKSKTVCVHFCQRRGLHCEPHLELDGNVIPVKSEAKFLGLTFDSKLNFVSHIKQLKAKCQKALNLLKVVAHTHWGADRKTLLKLYRSLIRSKLDYGSIVYGSARPSYIKLLDPIHNEGLRLCLGSFRTTPAESLYVQANEPSLYYRRDKLSLQYAAKLSANSTNATYKCVFEPSYQEIYDKRQKAIRPFGLRIQPKIEAAGLNLDQVAEQLIAEIPPWTIQIPRIIFDLCQFKKSETDNSIFINSFHEILECYKDYVHLYTDGSKDGAKVGAALVTPAFNVQSHLPDNMSIFTAELKALLLALEFIADSESERFVIFSDSLSSLQAIGNQKVESPLIWDFLYCYTCLLNEGKEIILCWLPSHIGIKGNEIADTAAKSAIELPISKFNSSYTDQRAQINEYIKDCWQSFWDHQKNLSKLHFVQSTLGEWPIYNRSTRREEVVLARLTAGHTRLTHSYLLKNEPVPVCVPCHDQYNVPHILLDCIDSAPMRENHYGTTEPMTMGQLFKNVPLANIFDFLKEINLFNKL